MFTCLRSSTAACLQLSPDRSQFSRYDTITLTCEGSLASNSTAWTVKRETPTSGVRRCSLGWGVLSSASTCIIRNAYRSDSGLYWCESVAGERSNGVNITITGNMLEAVASVNLSQSKTWVFLQIGP